MSNNDYADSQLSVIAAANVVAAVKVQVLDPNDTGTAPAGPNGSNKTATFAQLGGYAATFLAEPLAAGESLFPRWAPAADIAAASGVMALTAWTAVTPDSACNTVSLSTASTVAAGLTYANVGVYSVNSAGNGTLLASTGDIHATSGLFQTAYDGYDLTLTGSFTRTAGSRYAIGVLLAGTTMPSFGAFYGTNNLAQPWAAAQLTESTLPSSFTYGALSYGSSLLAAAVSP